MWFTETAWPPIILFLILGGIFFICWAQGKKAVFIAAILACIVACIATWYIEKRIVTPSEEVETAIVGIVDACENEDIDRMLNYVSPRAKELRFLIAKGMKIVEVTGSLSARDIEIEMLAENTKARSRFRANGTIKAMEFEQFYPSQWKVDWQQEGGEWKITSVTRLHPVNGKEMGVLEKQ